MAKCSEKPSLSASRNTTSSPASTDSARHMASPLPSTGPVSGISSALLHDARTRTLGDSRRPILRRGIHNEQLVDRPRLAQPREHTHDLPHRLRALARRQAHRHALLALSRDPRRWVQRMVEGTRFRPLLGCGMEHRHYYRKRWCRT